jgi:hypothetical protein
MNWFNPILIPTEYENEGIVPILPVSIGPTITLYSGDEYCGIEVYEDNVSAQSVKHLKAKRFVELIVNGKTPSKAAKEVNEDLARYQTKEEVQLAIRKVVENWTFSPEIRKLYSRALLMKIATEQGANTDPKSAKVALEAVKTMGQDDEVGWLNPKNAGPPAGNAYGPTLMKLLGGGQGTIENMQGEDEDDKAA